MLLPVASAELAKPMLLTPYAILLRKPFARAYTFALLGTLAHILLWVPHTHVGLGACITSLPQWECPSLRFGEDTKVARMCNPCVAFNH